MMNQIVVACQIYLNLGRSTIYGSMCLPPYLLTVMSCDPCADTPPTVIIIDLQFVALYVNICVCIHVQ